MDALENILNRVSARTLAEPYPSKDEILFPIDELPHKYLIFTPLCFKRSLINSIPI